MCFLLFLQPNVFAHKKSNQHMQLQNHEDPDKSQPDPNADLAHSFDAQC